MVCAWYEREVFDCANCEHDQPLKESLGCDGMPDPERNGNPRPWVFPPGAEHPKGSADRCPLKFIKPDVWDLARALALSEGRLSFSEQFEVPAPYLDAWSMLRGEQANRAAARAAEMRRRAQPA